MKRIWLRIISGKKMDRRKRGRMLLLIGCVVMLGLLGCSPESAAKYRAKVIREEQDMADEMMQSIVEALEAQDSNALKKLFSSYALKNAENLDEKIEELMEFYQGSSGEKEGGLCSAEGGIPYGKLILDSTYTMRNEEQEYEVTVITMPCNDEEPEKEGLYLIEVMTKEAKPEGFKWRNEDDEPGIYVLEPQERHW